MNNGGSRNQPAGFSGNVNYRARAEKLNRRTSAGISVVVCVIVALLTGVIGFTIGTRMQGAAPIGSLDYSQLNEVYRALSSKFDGNLDKQKLIEGAARGLVDAAGDEYTTYMTSDEMKELQTDLSGEIEGIGVEIGQNKDGYLSVISVLDDSPAIKAGLKAGDLIEKIDGRDSLKWNASQGASKVRGKSGTQVKLTIVRDNEEKEFTITRAKIDNPSVKWEIKNNNIGYMRISTFGDDTTDLAEQAAQEFKDKNVKGVVLDLRGNTGGYVDAARGVSSLWLDEGATITQERNGKGQVLDTVKATGDNILKGAPTVVLIDGSTASASEITAGALHDLAGAKLVGQKSYGKGVVQEVVNLNNGDELKVTVAKWYTPKGKNIQKQGIEPDEKVDMTAEQYNSGDDTQLNKALDILNK